MDPVTEPRRTQTSSAFTQIDIRHSLAAVIEKPKRSLIFVWHTGEEKGLWGAYYFAAHSPIPLEKISAQLNMDMLSRNDPQSIYLIGSRKLSSELDAAIHAVNDKYLFFNLDYKYENPGHPDRFFFRSDQYPYIRYGISAALPRITIRRPTQWIESTLIKWKGLPNSCILQPWKSETGTLCLSWIYIQK